MKKDELILHIILKFSGHSSEEEDETLNNMLAESSYARELYDEFKTRMASQEAYLQNLNETQAIELVRKILDDQSGNSQL